MSLLECDCRQFEHDVVIRCVFAWEFHSDMKKTDLLFRIVSGFLLLLLIICGVDLIRQGVHTGGVLAIFSSAWFVSISIYVVLSIVLAGLLIWGLLMPSAVMERVLSRRAGRFTAVRAVLVVMIIILPALLFLGPTGHFLTKPMYRLLAFILVPALVASLIPSDKYSLGVRLGFGGIAVAAAYAIGLRLVYATDYPFKLGWSEGNRLWDYSLYYMRDAYDVVGEFTYPNYLAIGRHGLWGLPFLFTGITIFWVRLWDGILWFLPALLLGLALFRPGRIKLPWLTRIGLILLTFLLVNQGPIYAPLVLSAAVVAFGLDPDKPVRSILYTAAASLYAGLSRWTWLVAPALWAAMICLLESSDTVQNIWWKRLIRPGMYAVAGLAGGILSQFISKLLFPSPELVSSTTLSQPMLWYRLFPNATYPEGVLLALALAVGPVCVLMGWAVWSKRVHLDWLQSLGIAGVLVSTLIVGLVISVKIGGGSNLHNLDMFLLSVVFLAASFLRKVQAEGTSQAAVPAWIYAMAALLVILPARHVMRVGGPLDLPPDDVVQDALRDIEDVVFARSFEGDVLFLDQRQLLTFGYIDGVPLVMEYELKDLTNRAMSGNAALFEDYYEDLENQRFSLIVTGHLPTTYTAPRHPFGEEDNAQFEFIYEPMFEYYEPVRQFEDVGVWLLEPITDLDQ